MRSNHNAQHLSPTALTYGAPSSEGAIKFSVQRHSYDVPREEHKAQAGVKSPRLQGLSTRSSDCFSRKRRSNEAIMKKQTFSF